MIATSDNAVAPVLIDRRSDAFTQPGFLSRTHMPHWRPRKQQRRELVARLDGFLDALARVDGDFGQHFMGARLFNLRGESIESALAALLRKDGSQLDVFSQRKPWTDVERFLRSECLRQPFGYASSAERPAFETLRHDLAFRTTDMVDALAVDFRPKGAYRVEMTGPRTERGSGCVVEYDRDALLISRFEWQSYTETTHRLDEARADE